MKENIAALNQQFGLPGEVNFYAGKGGLMTVDIKNEHAKASISLYGAQLLSYSVSGGQDLLWMSEGSFFEEGKAIRGGIPLCFPWFGPHPSDSAKPQHGFARLQYWAVQDISTTTTGATRLSLTLSANEATLAIWPFSFTATVEFVIGATMQLTLRITNTGEEDFEYSDALHTYFRVANINNIQVEGLAQATFYSGTSSILQTQNSALLAFDRSEETNRRYVNHTAACIIHDKGLNRKIQVSKSQSKVTVVWNPWEETAKKMVDLAPGGYKTFICVEPANAYPGIDMICLKPGESYALGTAFGLLA